MVALAKNIESKKTRYAYGNYLDEVWTIDDRVGNTIASLNDGTGGQRHFYHCNTLFHVYANTDETGAIAEGVQSYDAYGKVNIIAAGADTVFFTADDVAAGTSAIGNDFFYTGQRLDAETGLMYYKNRYMSVDLGRFVSRDPIGYAGCYGLYEYVGSRPCRSIDPLGLCPNYKCIGGTWTVSKGFSHSFGICIGYVIYQFRITCDSDKKTVVDIVGSMVTAGYSIGMNFSMGFSGKLTRAPCVCDTYGAITGRVYGAGAGLMGVGFAHLDVIDGCTGYTGGMYELWSAWTGIPVKPSEMKPGARGNPFNYGINKSIVGGFGGLICDGAWGTTLCSKSLKKGGGIKNTTTSCLGYKEPKIPFDFDDTDWFK